MEKEQRIWNVEELRSMPEWVETLRGYWMKKGEPLFYIFPEMAGKTLTQCNEQDFYVKSYMIAKEPKEETNKLKGVETTLQPFEIINSNEGETIFSVTLDGKMYVKGKEVIYNQNNTERKEVIGSGNSMGTTKILVENSKGEEIFKLKDDTITNNFNNMENKKVTLNNGTVLEAGGKYRLDMWSDTFYVECIKIHNDKCVMMEIDELEDICLFVYDFNRDWLPYTPPTPKKEWKTFLIEVKRRCADVSYRFFNQYESEEQARKHHPKAISITEVKLNIEEVK